MIDVSGGTEVFQRSVAYYLLKCACKIVYSNWEWLLNDLYNISFNIFYLLCLNCCGLKEKRNRFKAFILSLIFLPILEDRQIALKFIILWSSGNHIYFVICWKKITNPKKILTAKGQASLNDTPFLCLFPL